MPLSPLVSMRYDAQNLPQSFQWDITPGREEISHVIEKHDTRHPYFNFGRAKDQSL